MWKEIYYWSNKNQIRISKVKNTAIRTNNDDITTSGRMVSGIIRRNVTLLNDWH